MFDIIGFGIELFISSKRGVNGLCEMLNLEILTGVFELRLPILPLTNKYKSSQL